MSENNIEPQFQSGEGEGNQGGNPAWNDLLSVIPQDLHGQVTPHLKNWDAGVQQKINQVHGDYADYKFLKENKINPEDVRVSLGVLRALQEDPRSVYDSLAQTYGYAGEQQQQQQNQPQGQDDLSQLPPEILQKLTTLEGGYNTMAQILLEQQKQEEANAEDKKLEEEFAALKQKHGEFDENYVIAQMMQGMSGDQAVKAYQDFVNTIARQNSAPPAPRLLGSGTAAIPGEGQIDVRKMDGAQTKKFVAEWLRAKAQNI